MCECVAASLGGTVNSKASEVKVFFEKLSIIRKGAAIAVFILDGQGRPKLKRGKEVVDRDLWWLHLAIRLIEYFRFYWYKVCILILLSLAV